MQLDNVNCAPRNPTTAHVHLHCSLFTGRLTCRLTAFSARVRIRGHTFAQRIGYSVRNAKGSAACLLMFGVVQPLVVCKQDTAPLAPCSARAIEQARLDTGAQGISETMTLLPAKVRHTHPVERRSAATLAHF